MLGIGELLRRRRRELGHNQTKAAEALGVSGPTVSRWETGEAAPSTEQIEGLVAYLAMSEPQVLAAIHRQVSGEDSDDRVLTMLGEVLEQMAELRQMIAERPSP